MMTVRAARPAVLAARSAFSVVSSGCGGSASGGDGAPAEGGSGAADGGGAADANAGGGGLGASGGDGGAGTTSGDGGAPSGAADGGAHGGDGGSGDGGATSDAGGVMPTQLPTATGTCPAMSNLSGTAVTFAGQQVTVWSGDPAKGPGPLLIYWYATGSSPSEAPSAIGQAQMTRVLAAGGVVAAQNQTTAQGGTTGNDVWYKGDATIADEVVACAVKNQKIDVRHISSLGYSAGALQSTFMWYARSGYLASVITYSGGEDGADQVTMQDPAHPPAAVVAHGAEGSDVYGTFDFYDASTAWEKDLVAAKAFTVDCDDGGDHGDFTLRTMIAPEAFQLLVDHPYGVSPEPYATLPGAWPSYCTIKK
jgi:hypothetical protein